MKTDGSVKYITPETPHQQGVTLVELMVALTVLAIGLGIALPSFKGSIERSRSDFALQRVEEAMQVARLAAINQNTSYSIGPRVADDGWQSGMVVQRISNGALLREYQPFGAAVSIAVQTAGEDIDQVVFNGLGGLDVSAILVSIAAGEASRSLNICPNGRIRRGGDCG